MYCGDGPVYLLNCMLICTVWWHIQWLRWFSHWKSCHLCIFLQYKLKKTQTSIYSTFLFRTEAKICVFQAKKTNEASSINDKWQISTFKILNLILHLLYIIQIWETIWEYTQERNPNRAKYVHLHSQANQKW